MNVIKTKRYQNFFLIILVQEKILELIKNILKIIKKENKTNKKENYIINKKGKCIIDKKKIKNRIESLIEEYKYFEIIIKYYGFNSNVEKLKERYDNDYGYVFHMLNEEIIKGIDDSLILKEEENKLIYGTPFFT